VCPSVGAGAPPPAAVAAGGSDGRAVQPSTEGDEQQKRELRAPLVAVKSGPYTFSHVGSACTRKY
jgi:hypothetical protein